jgi:N-acetylmuramoyl-L-alanine amidase
VKQTVLYFTAFALVVFVGYVSLTSLTHAVPVQRPAPVIVVVDPGHGGSDSGATGFRDLREKDLTLAIALQVQRLAASDSALRIVLTRESDVSVPLIDRTALANRLGAALYLSIHINAYPRSTRISGIEPLVPSDHDPLLAGRDLAFAKTLHGLLVEQLRGIDRGIYPQNLYLHHAQMPAALVEAGFITNPTDAEKLNTPSYQEKIAQILLDGIKAYLHMQKPNAPSK